MVGSGALQMLCTLSWQPAAFLNQAWVAVLHGNYHHGLTTPLSNQIAWLKLTTV